VAQPVNRKLSSSRRSGSRAIVSEELSAIHTDSKVVEDRRLVDRCVAGETTAWSSLYGYSHDSLLAGIRAFLGTGGHDANLVDEIAARVWYALVKDDFELLNRFDIRHGCRLSTFLSIVAKNEARLLLRSEKRRKVRELAASKHETESSPTTDVAISLSDEEFVLTLSPAERIFYFEVLIDRRGTGSSAKYSEQYRWQLRHRIRKKLERFISSSP
jgi:DNA-directed RNA polymerase specialized sigma24 family protein